MSAIKMTEDIKFIMDEIIPEINDLFPYINYGGCGCFAYIISEHLEALNIEHAIACMAYFCDNMTEEAVRQVVLEGCRDDIPNQHLLLEIAGELFDADGSQTYPASLIKAKISRETLGLMLEVDCWNNTFDRDDLPEIELFVQQAFERLSI